MKIGKTVQELFAEKVGEIVNVVEIGGVKHYAVLFDEMTYGILNENPQVFVEDELIGVDGKCSLCGEWIQEDTGTYGECRHCVRAKEIGETEERLSIWLRHA